MLFTSLAWGLDPADHEATQEVESAPNLHADGAWSSGQGARVSAPQWWSVDALRLTDNEVRGRIAFTGVPQVSAANLEARLSGRGVSGRLLDDEGNTLAYFEGAVSAGGASGTFRHRGGEGRWSWDGPAAAQIEETSPAPQ